jgi:hypothetical protein
MAHVPHACKSDDQTLMHACTSGSLFSPHAGWSRQNQSVVVPSSEGAQRGQRLHRGGWGTERRWLQGCATPTPTRLPRSRPPVEFYSWWRTSPPYRPARQPRRQQWRLSASAGPRRSSAFWTPIPARSASSSSWPGIEDGQKIAHDEVIEEGATISTLGVLDHVPDGVDLRPVDPGQPQRRGSPDRGHRAAQSDQHPQPRVPTLWITATPIRRISV